MRWSVVAGLMALLSATACQATLPATPSLPRTSAQAARHAFIETGAPGNADEFRLLCQLKGADLDATSLQSVAKATTILPSGEWHGDLKSVWRREGLPDIASPDVFFDTALSFARKRDATVGFYFDAKTFRETGDVLVVHWEPTQGQYLVLGTDGKIREYRRHTPAPAAELVRVPADLMPGAR